MQQASQLQLLPSGQSSFRPQPTPSFQDKAGTLCSQPQYELPASRKTLLQQPDKGKMVSHHIPRLRAVVESQAFKNVLVDEMDLMLSHAATLIQANWRGYRLRQKLISQMLAAKAIQEAWRRLYTRRLLRSGKEVEKKVSMDEGDIPYHPPQQVRFQPAEEGKFLPAPPVMVSRETQSPSADISAACTHQLALVQPSGIPQPGVQAPCATGGPSVTFLPQQTVSMRLPCPASPDAKRPPCLLTGTVRSASLVHVESDTTKIKQVTTRANKGGALGPPPCGRCAQELHRPLKTQTQGHVEAEVLKDPPQPGQASVMTKTPLQQCPVSTMTMTKTPPQMYPAAAKTPLQSCLASLMNKTRPQPRPAPTVTIPKTPPQVDPAAPVAKTPLQSCLAAILNKNPTQPCPVPTIMITKTPPQPCLVAPVTKTSAQMQPTASMTNTASQTQPAAILAKISPQICLLSSVIKPPTQTCPVPAMAKTRPQTCQVPIMSKTPPQTCQVPVMAKTQPQTCQVPVMAKTPPQTCQVPVMAKTPPQTCQVPVMAKTPPQMHPSATMAKTPLQTCPVATVAKTPSQTLPGSSMTKIPPQTRLAAMITKTPAQLRSVATILRTLCLPPSAAGNLKASSPAVVAAGIPNTSSYTCLNRPKAKAVVTARQTAGMVKVSSHSHLTEGKVKYCPSPHLGAGAPKAPARPFLEGEKIKAASQKQMKTATMSNTRVAEDRSKVSSQAQLRKDVTKVQSKVYMPVETNVVLPQAQLGSRPAKVPPQAQKATCSTPASSRGHLFAKLSVALPQANLGTFLSKPPPQAHLPAKLTKAPTLAHQGTCPTKLYSRAHLTTGLISVQSQADLSTRLTKTQSQVQLVTQTAKCLYTAHPATEEGKTQSQPLPAGFKASTQPCQQAGPFGTLSQAKPEDRLTQLPAHSYAQGKASQGPHQEASETQSMLVPLLASTGHLTCNVESCGDSGTTWAQPSTTSPAAPCQEELVASQLASLCAELAAVLGSQEDLRDLLTKALSQGEVRVALNQALSKEVLGTMMAKVLPQGMLGTALVKALSWGELGATLSRALSRGELRAELTKAMQGKLGDVLSKALTEEEWAALNQALCQGELGAILSQSLSQAALRTGLILPKAASKTLGSGMMVTPAPVEVTYRGSPPAAWGPTLGCVRPQTSKVRVPLGGAWEVFVTGWPAGLLEEMGDGTRGGVGGSPCLSMVLVGASILQFPLITGLDPTPSWEMGLPRECLYPGPGKLALDLKPRASDAVPNLPGPLPLQLPHQLWQPLIANGMTPSTSWSLMVGGMAPSSHKPHVASRVVPHLLASLQESRVAPDKLASSAGGRRAIHSHQCATAYGGPARCCQPSGVTWVTPGVYWPSAAKSLQQPFMVPEETMQRTQSLNYKQASVGSSEMINKVTSGLPRATAVSNVPLTQPQTLKACDRTPGPLPSSMAPGHHRASKSQGEARLLEAFPGGRLKPTLLHTALPGQEKNRTQGIISGMHYPQELVTGHLLSELVAHLPQGPHSDLTRSFSQGSTDYGLNVGNPQSSLCCCSSLSLYAMSVVSLSAADLVEEESREAGPDGDFLTGEVMGRSQGPGDLKEVEGIGHGHMTPNLYHLAPLALEAIPILHHSSGSGHVTLSVHWGSGSQDERGMSSSQNFKGPKGSLCQKPNRTGLNRSLCSGDVVPPSYQQPALINKLIPSLSQPSVASQVAPNPGQLPMSSKDPSSLTAFYGR